MKNLFTIMGMICLLSANVYATTLEGIEPVLQYDHESYYDHSKSEFGYLTLVREKISFPSRTQLGKRQEEKFNKALDLLEEVMNSDEFRKRVISYIRPNGSKEYKKNYLWRDSESRLSNKDVFEVIMNGNEKMRENTLGEMNFNSKVKICKWYENAGVWCRKVIGSTSPSSSAMIKMNWKFYQKYEAHQMVSNMVHEWLHLLGFLHGNEDMREEVPYIVGSIAGQVAKEILERENKLL
jgi:hypothetical protein